jgi:16S rRNA G966 N2-methylase RsmD
VSSLERQTLVLTREAARSLTDEVKADAAALWKKLLALYEGGAHTALGYASWADYCANEFDMRSSAAYRMLDAGRVVAMLDAHSPNGERLANEAQARELIPVLRDEGEQAVIEVFRELRAEYGDDVTAKRIKNVVGGRLARARRQNAAREQDAAVLARAPSDVRIEQCDVRRLDVEPGSVDLILTDPPYAREHFDLWSELGVFAARALKPGGSLVAMAGQAHVPEYVARLSEHLTYRWICAYTCDRSSGVTRVHGRRFASWWKPLLVFDRQVRSERRFVMEDLFHSDGKDKRFHEWGQSEGGFVRVVERFTDPGNLVVDPFLGGGTTAAVAHRLGRRFVGCDVDPNAVAVARRRLASSEPEPRDDLADYAESELERVRAKFGEAS